MIEHMSKPVACILWSILNLIMGYSGVSLFCDVHYDDFSGLLMIVTIPCGIVSGVVLSLVNAGYIVMISVAAATFITGAIGVSNKKLVTIVYTPPIFTLFYTLYHFYHGLLVLSTAIEFGLVCFVATLCYIFRDRLDYMMNEIMFYFL
jgi:hypothetical protein